MDVSFTISVIFFDKIVDVENPSENRQKNQGTPVESTNTAHHGPRACEGQDQGPHTKSGMGLERMPNRDLPCTHFHDRREWLLHRL